VISITQTETQTEKKQKNKSTSATTSIHTSEYRELIILKDNNKYTHTSIESNTSASGKGFYSCSIHTHNPQLCCLFLPIGVHKQKYVFVFDTISASSPLKRENHSLEYIPSKTKRDASIKFRFVMFMTNYKTL